MQRLTKVIPLRLAHPCRHALRAKQVLPEVHIEDANGITVESIKNADTDQPVISLHSKVSNSGRVHIALTFLVKMKAGQSMLENKPSVFPGVLMPKQAMKPSGDAHNVEVAG